VSCPLKIEEPVNVLVLSIQICSRKANQARVHGPAQALGGAGLAIAVIVVGLPVIRKQKC
jgi:hypothetical protein